MVLTPIGGHHFRCHLGDLVFKLLFHIEFEKMIVEFGGFIILE